jgi:hypothetical protein
MTTKQEAKSKLQRKTAEVRLPYHKQGDDLSYQLEKRGLPLEEALEAHASNLEEAASMLRQVREKVAGKPVEILAGTHFIEISGPGDLIDELVKEGLASILDYDDEDVADPHDGAN